MTLSAPGTAWINRAEEHAAGWPDATLGHVLDAFPYPPERNVRRGDWAILVAAVSTAREEDPILCAQRLASYVKARSEQTGHLPTPDQVRRSQTP